MIKVFSGFSPKKVPIVDTFDCVVLASFCAWETFALMGVLVVAVVVEDNVEGKMKTNAPPIA